MSPAMIVAKGLSRRFGRITAVDDVSLTVAAGTVLGIVGESGCGKTTLARLLLGLLAADAGRILIDGNTLAALDRRSRARLIQPVFQDPFHSLNPRQTVADIVALPLKAQGGIGRAEVSLRVGAMLDRVGLSAAHGARLPAALSGGQRQRVAIARALVLRPRVIILDEPTSALDVSVQAQILNLLADLREEFSLTCVVISHNLAVVEHIADEVAVMYLGRIVERAPTRDLFAAPVHPYTQALLACVLTPDPDAGLPDVGLGDMPADPEKHPTGCRFHPRCPSAETGCASETPRPRMLNDTMVECLLAG